MITVVNGQQQRTTGVFRTTKPMLTPMDAAEALGEGRTAAGRQKVYRMLEAKYLQDIGDRIGCPVFKNGARFLIPLAIIKKIEGENIDDAA